MAETNTTITIGKKEFKLQTVMLNQSELKFYPENPRIHSIVCQEGGKAPSQDDIQRVLCGKEYVRDLRDSIITNGGLIEPVIVRKIDGENIVLEGNSRLAAYRMLYEQDPIKWGKIKCNIFTDDITEAEVFVLLGQLHIIGKTDWSLYEQAGYLYRTKVATGNSIDDISKMLGLKVSEAKRLYEIYSYMVDKNDTIASHWSYYEVLLKTNAFKPFMKTSQNFEDTIVKKIKAEEFPAIDLRDKLGSIAKDNSKDSVKLVNAFIAGDLNLDEAFESFHDTGKDEDTYKIIKKFRDKIYDENTLKQMKKAVAEGNDQIPYELKKIKQRVNTMLKELGAGDK